MDVTLTRVKSLVPEMYTDVTETDIVYNTQQENVDSVKAVLDYLWAMAWVETSDEEAIVKYERLVNIVPDHNLSIETRRKKVVNRLSFKLPFTERSLQKHLDSVFGKGICLVDVDTHEYTVSVVVKSSDFWWTTELQISIENIKPANLILIFKPYNPHNIVVGEAVHTDLYKHPCILNGSWIFEQKRSFLEVLPWERIKDMSTPSLTVDALRYSAVGLAHSVDHASVNDVVISSFTRMDVENDTLFVEYRVPASLSGHTLTESKLYDDKNNVISHVTFSLPYVEDMVMSHKIIYKEGA